MYNSFGNIAGKMVGLSLKCNLPAGKIYSFSNV